MRARVALPALFLVPLALGWWLLAPTALGGRATYVVSHGVSMQPRFHTGDLAVVYPASDYQPGQVAAYRSSLLHTVVLHRIVARTADGYVFKGDNNSWLDPEHPTAEQMVGRLVVRVPRGGAVLGSIRKPVTVALLAGLIAGLGATGATGLRRRRRSRRRTTGRTGPEGVPMNLHPFAPDGSARSGQRALAAAAALVFASLVAATYVAPGHRVEVEKVPWTTEVSYGYTASSGPNLVYPDGQVHAGQTVFRKLVDTLVVRAMFSLRTPADHDVEGTVRLQVTVHGPAGWAHSVDVGSVQRFDGAPAVVTGRLDLGALDALVTHAATLTGVPAQSYTVSVQPLVDLDGTLAWVPFSYRSSGHEPAMNLAVTSATVTTAASTPSAPASGTDPTAGAAASTGTSAQADGSSQWLDPHTDTHSTTVTGPAAPGWSVHGVSIRLTWVRWVGTLAAAAALVAFVVLLLAKPGAGDPCVRQARRYRTSIVAVAGLRVASTGNVVDVTSLRGLAQIAQRYDRLILQQGAAPGTYVVEDETGLYRYQCPHRASGQPRRRHLAEHRAVPLGDSETA